MKEIEFDDNKSKLQRTICVYCLGDPLGFINHSSYSVG